MNATGIDTHLKKVPLSPQHSSTAKICCTEPAIWPSQVSQQRDRASSAAPMLALWSKCCFLPLQEGWVCRSYNTAVLTHATMSTSTGCARVLSLLLALSLLASSPCLATSDALGDVVSALTGAPRSPGAYSCLHLSGASSAGLHLFRVLSRGYQLIAPHNTPATRLYVPVCSDSQRLPAWQKLCLTESMAYQALTAHLSLAGCKDKNAIYFVSDYNENQVRAFHGTSGALGMRFFVGVAYRTKCKQLSTWVRRQVHWCRAAAEQHGLRSLRL